ncbi:MAG: transglycosylase domain-containing protein [Clostridia bacterium]|nr:transglycosylase domain-containing protein [Clostridia bacterium]
MKKGLRFSLLILSLLLVAILGFVIYYFSLTFNVNLNKNKLVNLNCTIEFYDVNNKLIEEDSNNIKVCEISKMPKNLINAFVSIEDKRFFTHNGIDYRSITRAMLNNIKHLSFVEGASTISQQLIKNTHLSNEKTINRKLLEYKLTKQLENEFSKEEILEMYLNTIYFGHNCFGVSTASNYYFNKEPNELNLQECAILAGLVKAPAKYSPILNSVKSNERKNVVLKEMLKQNYITDTEYNHAINNVNLTNYTNKKVVSYLDVVKSNLDEIINKRYKINNKLKVYTNYNENMQNILEETFKNDKENCDKTYILSNKNSKITAYLSTCGEIKRQLGSTIKPLLIYAPAIEMDYTYPCNYIFDEKTTFNDYTPRNYNENYLGKITVKDAIAKSSNVCAVKTLNQIGINNCKIYANKLNLELTEKDNSLVIALGCTEKGAKLSNLVSAYTTFMNEGINCKPTFINKITLNNNVIYKNNGIKHVAFSRGTVDLINDALEYTTLNGTAKKLKNANVKLCAKTGTVGSNAGNLDAYCISYNQENCLGVWYGNANNKPIENITGGGVPANKSLEIWNNIYKEKRDTLPYCKSSESSYYNVDKKSLEEDNKLIFASEYMPEKYIEKVLLKNKTKVYGNSYNNINSYAEKPKYIVNNNVFSIKLCQTEFINYVIYKETNGKKVKAFDTNNKNYEYTELLNKHNDYTFYYLPYYKNNNKVIYGKEEILCKIKSPLYFNGDNWWDDLE